MISLLSYREKKAGILLTAPFWAFLVLISVSFFQDGHSSLDFVRDSRNIDEFLVYFLMLMVCQAFTFYVLLRKYKGQYKSFFSALIGIPPAFLILHLFFTLTEINL